MKGNLLKYILFTIVLAYTSSWSQINLLLSSLGKEKTLITVVEDKQIQQLIYDKANVDIEKIKISETDKPFGMMVGIPTKPQLILSRNLYDTFTPNEIEYVVLHEVGHYKLYHSMIELIVGVFLLIIGIIVLRKTVLFPQSLLISLFLGLIFGVLMIRLGRFHEYQADNFAVKTITDPQGMIKATNKFRNFHGKKYTENKNKLIQFLFYRGNPYDNRIKMAETEIETRKLLNLPNSITK